MPALTSSIGIRGVAAGKVAAARDVPTKAATRVAVRNFMSLWRKRRLLSVIRTNCLQVKEKGVIVRSSMTLFTSVRVPFHGTNRSYWRWYSCAEGAIH
jgi:hypothetical protein